MPFPYSSLKHAAAPSSSAPRISTSARCRPGQPTRSDWAFCNASVTLSVLLCHHTMPIFTPPPALVPLSGIDLRLPRKSMKNKKQLPELIFALHFRCVLCRYCDRSESSAVLIVVVDHCRDCQFVKRALCSFKCALKSRTRETREPENTAKEVFFPFFAYFFLLFNAVRCPIPSLSLLRWG